MRVTVDHRGRGPGPAARGGAVAHPAITVLRRAGNRATASYLARGGITALQRDDINGGAPPPPPPAPKVTAPPPPSAPAPPGAAPTATGVPPVPIWKAARARKDALDKEASQRANKLFVNPAEGSFEYVAQYLYASLDDNHRRPVFDKCFEAFQVGAEWQVRQRNLDDGEKRRILEGMLPLALGSFAPGAHKKVEDEDEIDLSLKDIPTLLKDPKIKGIAPTAVQTSDKREVGIGYHTTMGNPNLVLQETTSGGWGGLSQTRDVPFFKKRYALDAAWNPLGAEVSTGAHFRRGENYDNELLSTVSIATRAGPSIKFPFPSGTSSSVSAYIYAAVYDKAYPTFLLQADAFAEVSADKVAPKDLIGSVEVQKDYDPMHINQAILRHRLALPTNTNQHNERFMYTLGRFERNYTGGFMKHWGKDALKLYGAAQKDMADQLGRRGIYDSMNITRIPD